MLEEFFRFSIFWDVTRDLQLPAMAEALDEACSAWADMMFMEGHPAYLGERLYASLQDLWPALNAHGSVRLPEFYRCRQSWRRRAPGRSRTPLTLTQLRLIVDWVLRRRLPAMALWLVVCFTTYYRPSEVFSLRVGDLLRPTRRLRHHGLQLHPFEMQVGSKARQFDDGVPLDSEIFPWLPKAMVRTLRLNQRAATDKMFDFQYKELLSLFRQACEELKVRDPSLYRLRHGGASHDAATRMRTLQEIKRRGRWASDTSLRRYEKRTWLQAEEAKVSPTQQCRAIEIERNLAARSSAWTSG